MAEDAATEIRRPLPVPDLDSQRYWQGCREHRLTAPKCLECGLIVFPPRMICPKCLSDQFEWISLTGLGKVYSFTIVRRGPSAAFKDKVPYAMALIDLDEGPRMLSNIVGTPLELIRIGMCVKCIFEDVTEEVSLPQFIGINGA